MMNKHFYYLYIVMLFLAISSTPILAADADMPMGGDLIRGHVTDGDIEKPDKEAGTNGSIFYPIAKVLKDIGITFTKHVLMLWIAAFVTITMALWATRRYRNDIHAKPKGLSHLYEMLIDFIKKEIIIPNIGASGVKRWTPLAASFFVFILTCNLLGLIPFFEKVGGAHSGGATATGNFGVTVGLAFITFIAIIIAGTLKHGFIGHWKNMIPGGVPAPVLIILIPIEIIGMFVKPLALTLRLGANMTAGHIGMLAIFGLPYLIAPGGDFSITWGAFGFIAVILNFGIYFLEIIVSLVQAYVFTLLSMVFIGMAIHADH